MPPEIIRAGLRLGVLVLVMSLMVLPFVPTSSVEFWMSVAAAGVVLLFIGGLVVVVSVSHQSPPGKG